MSKQTRLPINMRNRGGIAKYLAVSFLGMTGFAVLTVLSVVIFVHSLENNFTDAITRTNLAFLGAQVQNKSDQLMALSQRYISPTTHAQERLDLRHQIAQVRSETEALFARVVAQTAEGDLVERTLLASIERKYVDLYLQVNRMLQTYDMEGELGQRTIRQNEQLRQDYQAPLAADISSFQSYETGRVQEAHSRALGLIQIISASLPLAAVLVIGLTGWMTLRAFQKIILPLGELNAGVERLRTGQLDIQLPVRGSNEIGNLAATLNEMAAQLHQTLVEIRQLNAELERRVRERTAELEAANQELEAFAYSVSHDLRTPLRSIDGYSKLLLEDYCPSLDEQGQHYLHNVRLAAQRMSQLIEDLLKLSRVTRAEMSRTSVDLSSLALEVLDELRARQPWRLVTVLVQPGLVVEGDKNLLRIMLENMLGNAWKFTVKTEAARIELTSFDQEGQTVYQVCDNGAGFDMKYAGKLFSAFQRLHHLEDYEGTGIGLATVQRIVNRHGGRVWAEGTVNQGAAFYFTL